MVSSRKKLAAVLFAAPVALLSACTPPNEQPSDAPGTTPSVWTGAPAPSGEAHAGAPAEGAADSLTTQIKAADGVAVASATFEFEDGYVKVTVQTTGTGQLAPGFHGVHLHKVGKCEAASEAPGGGGAHGDFNSAGGHFQVAGHTTEPASGDLTSLQVRKDGSALLVTTTDAFNRADLLAGEGTAIIIHDTSDNFGNIPDRYTQGNGSPGPDEMTMSTGDSGKRVACGVIGSG